MSRYLTSLSETDIVRAMGPFSYGKGTERTTQLLIDTLAGGLLQIAAGFAIGGTLHGILRNMGLITVRRGTLTKAGRHFMFDCYRGAPTDYAPVENRAAPSYSEAAQPAGNGVKPAPVFTP